VAASLAVSTRPRKLACSGSSGMPLARGGRCANRVSCVIFPRCGRFAGRPAGPAVLWLTGPREVHRSPRSWTVRSRRFLPCLMSGAMSIGPTANLRTEARTWPDSGCHLRRFGGYLTCRTSTFGLFRVLGSRRNACFQHGPITPANSIWIYDTTHFPRAGMAVLIIEDLVSPKWINEGSPQKTDRRVR